jgi:secretion/DNA translocation related TadE-like protein
MSRRVGLTAEGDGGGLECDEFGWQVHPVVRERAVVGVEPGVGWPWVGVQVGRQGHGVGDQVWASSGRRCVAVMYLARRSSEGHRWIRGDNGGRRQWALRCRLPGTAHGPVDRGSGTVWMVALMALVWVVAVAAMTVGGARAARHRAHAAADLAALAAASHVTEGPSRACAVAASVARSMRGRLTACALRSRVADVVVSAVARVPGFGSFDVAAPARAGPVWAPMAVDRPPSNTGG